jgi:hypothetical protein
LAGLIFAVLFTSFIYVGKVKYMREREKKRIGGKRRKLD